MRGALDDLAATAQDLLSKLSPKNCWQDKSAHAGLRVRALWELGRFEECVAAGKAYASDPRVKKWLRLCRKRLDKGSGG